jgi:predicted dehydrogenase
MRRIEAVMVGAGGRGTRAYGPYALEYPDELTFVAVAEPIKERREYFARQHNIAPEKQYESWEDLVAGGQVAEAAFNCTLDPVHHASTMALIDAGYHVLLEKPMTPTVGQSVDLVQTAEKAGQILQICHELRYTTFFNALYDVVNSGKLGRVITIDHRENVAFWHMAHSFVRGNWRNSEETAPMILAKCCHDMDLLYWTLDSRVKYLSSFGTLTHYKADNAPEGAPLYCQDGCPVAEECPWYAPRFYLGDIQRLPIGDSSFGQRSLEERTSILHKSRFGRCVYHCDNNVVDHQVVNMEFENEITVTLTMQGHSEQECRTMRYDGTKATMHAKFAYGEEDWIRVTDHRTGITEDIPVDTAGISGHGGGDFRLVSGFLQSINGDSSAMRTSARESLESHLMAFAAEEARLSHRVVNMAEFRARAETLTQ